MVVHVIDFSAASGGDPKRNRNPLHPLGRPLRDHLWRGLERARKDANITSVVLTGGATSPHFSAGADLTELNSVVAGSSADFLHNNKESRTLIDLCAEIEAFPKPVIAAIRGACLGGGLELALACHYRVAGHTKSTKLGLPEVHVGLIPGAGGTQRLPRLIGLTAALPMILTGAPVNASKALKLKLVDAVVNDDDDYRALLELATNWARWAEVLPLDPRRIGSSNISEPPPVAHALCHAAGLTLPKRGSAGLRAALDAMRASSWNDFEQGMARERELFLEALVSDEGKARRHAFFAVRKAQTAVSRDNSYAKLQQHPLLQSSNPAKPAQAAVIGAGTMGGGIALVLLRAGFAVTVVDVAPKALEKGVKQIQSTIQGWVQRKKISAAQAQDMEQRLSSTTQLENKELLADCQLVVEAVVENLSVKQSIFRTLDQTITNPDCLFLTNTSTLDVDQIMSAVPPTRTHVAGWHFFSPAHVMQLVEIVVAQRTNRETVSILQRLTKRIGKIGVVVGNCDGFCGNRMLRPYSAEMLLAVVEHCDTSIQDVDAAMLRFGMALGPFQMADLAGNDIGYNIRRERGWVRDGPKNNSKNNANSKQQQPPPNRPARYSEVGDDMVTQLGRLGQKAGKGWYDYDPAIGKGRQALPSPEMDRFLQRYRHNNNKKKLSEQEIVERLLYPLVNEGFKCLEEGVARCPSDIDVVYLYGYGWPAWRGGPMYWADHSVGLDVLLDRLQELHRQFPETDHFCPSPLLEECVRKGVTVEEYYAQNEAAATRSKL